MTQRSVTGSARVTRAGHTFFDCFSVSLSAPSSTWQLVSSSVELMATAEFTATDTGVHIRLTEYGAYFDGIEDPNLRREGTVGLLDALAAVLES